MEANETEKVSKAKVEKATVDCYPEANEATKVDSKSNEVDTNQIVQDSMGNMEFSVQVVKKKV